MDFPRWAAGLPGLIWFIEHRRSRIKLLNDWQLPALGVDTPRILKDVRFWRDAVCESDQPLLLEFWEMMASRQMAAVLFHLREHPGVSCLLQGWPAPGNPELCCGMLMEAALPATFVANGEAGTCQLALGRAQYPVFVLNVAEGGIITCNEAADRLFGLRARGGKFLLGDIAPGSLAPALISAARKAIADQIWAGTLMLRSSEGNFLGSKVRISPCSPARDIVRVALLNIPDASAYPDTTPDIIDTVGPFSLKDELNKLLAACPDLGGLMFSDIQSHHGRVKVYGVGKLFARLAWGEKYAYEGTIAQDIERFSLDSLTVEDTLDSIKSIDWAMFIPCGVRSYFAKPFYSAAGLHAVLILASNTPRPSGALDEERFRPLYEPFARIIARWRAEQKRRKRSGKRKETGKNGAGQGAG